MFLLLKLKRGKTERKIASEIKKASSLWARTKGLLGSQKLTSQQGLWIHPGKSIHTIGMTYNIDVIYIDKQQIVKKLVQNIAPFRLSFAAKNTYSVLELQAGKISESDIRVNDQLIFL